MSLMQKLRGSSMKGALVGTTGAVLTLMVLDGTQGVAVFGHTLPKFIVNGVALGATSVASDFIIPHLTPYISIGSPQLQKFDNLVIAPLVIGVLTMGLESLVAPAAKEDVSRGGLLKEISVGVAASVAASYVAEGMGWQTMLA